MNMAIMGSGPIGNGKFVLELSPEQVQFFPIESLRYASRQELDDLYREHIQANADDWQFVPLERLPGLPPHLGKLLWPPSDGNKSPGTSSTGAE